MKLIYLTSRFPYPINKGDKLRSYFQIKELSKFYEIHLISLTEKKINDIDIKKYTFEFDLKGSSKALQF